MGHVLKTSKKWANTLGMLSLEERYGLVGTRRFLQSKQCSAWFLELLAEREMLTINHSMGPKVTGITHLAWCVSCEPASYRQTFTSISSAVAGLSLSASFPITHKLCKSRGGNEDAWGTVPVLTAITAGGRRELEVLVFLLAGLEISGARLPMVQNPELA